MLLASRVLTTSPPDLALFSLFLCPGFILAALCLNLVLANGVADVGLDLVLGAVVGVTMEGVADVGLGLVLGAVVADALASACLVPVLVSLIHLGGPVVGVA